MKRTITLILMTLLVIGSANAQTTKRSKGKSILSGNPTYTESSYRGGDWEVFKFEDKRYHYFLGNDAVDNIDVDQHLLGFHWRGKDLTLNDSIYLCNMETGEYLEIGGLWGENTVTSHVGIPFKIKEGTSTRRWGVLSDMGSDVYWIQPLDVREDRVLGRAALGGGTNGHFEHNRYIFLRTQREYDGDNTGVASHPGGMPFKFQKYEVEGQTCFVIYTHRKTQGQTGNKAEFKNRDSYLLLTSTGSSETSDVKSVRFRKFAGEMYGADVEQVKATLTDKTDLPSITTQADATATAAHKWGTYSPSASAATQYVTTNTNELTNTPGVTVTTDAAYMDAAYYGDPSKPSHEKYRHTMRFNLNDNSVHTITISAPYGYVITSYTIHALTTRGAYPCKVTMDDAIDEEEGTASQTTINSDVQVLTLSGISKSSTTLTIQRVKDGGTQLCFPEFYVTLAQVGKADSYPVGDEVDFYNINARVVDVEDALNNENSPYYVSGTGNKNNLWKIVTKKQRDRYRIVASETKPIDVSSRIRNPEFNTSYVYNVLYSDCELDGSNYVHKDWDAHPNYHWTWYNEDRPEHNVEEHKPHVHPWPAEANESTLGYSKEKEFHKVGTGRFWRFSERNATNNGYIGGHDTNMQEMNITRGVDANYCGSIFKGTANIQQTIGTGAEGDPPLREGNYIVYVHGFFAPHDMEKYEKQKDEDGTYHFDGSPMGSAGESWKNEAFIEIDGEGDPVWRRSHDSYLFAWSKPDGTNIEEVRRMLPSIYEGATPVDKLGTMSRNEWIAEGGYLYTPMHNRGQADRNLIMDEHVFGFYNGNFFNAGISGKYAVPRTVSGAARFFDASDKEEHPEAQNYRIGLPVYVGSDGQLTIGVDHTRVTGETPYKSGDYEWVCFDNFELLYLGADEPEEFVVDELEAQGYVPSYPYINGHTGEPFKDTDPDEMGEQWDDFYNEYIGKSSPTNTTRRNNTQMRDIFSNEDINNLKVDDSGDIKTVKNLIIRRTMTKDKWNSIVLPVPLTMKQVEEGFGAGTLLSKLHHETPVLGRTLVYEAVEDGMEAGKPYIIKPTAEPTISDADFYDRFVYTKKVANTDKGAAGLYFKGGKDLYYRNYEIDHRMAGPIYVIEDVDIDARVVFPYATTTKQTGALEWTKINGGKVNEVEVERKSVETLVNVRGYSKDRFTLVETGFYENPGEIPANTYYLNKGEYRYTSTGFGTTKGLLAYIQLLDGDDSNKPYAKPFLESDMYFERYVEDIDGVLDVKYQPETNATDIYDLQGRKVNKLGKGLYIMNGRKVLFK